MKPHSATIIPSLPATISDAFRDELSTIESMFRNNTEFRDLCIDYNDCVVALRALLGGESTSDPRIADYRLLRKELSLDIRHRLADGA